MNPNSLFKKLRLSNNQNKLILNAPTEFFALLVDTLYDVQIDPEKKGNYDFVAVFGRNKNELEQLTPSLTEVGKYDCLFWVCYPKGTGKIKSDLKRDIVWQVVNQMKLRCVTQIAINDTWSALRARPDAAVGT